MDIKSKKSKIYSPISKILAIILIFVSVFTLFSSLIGIIQVTKDWNTSPLFVNDYTDTIDFIDKFDILVDKAVLVGVYYKSQGNIEEGNVVDEEYLLKSFKDYYNIVDGVITSNTEVQDDKVILKGTIPENLKENYIEYKELIETRLSTFRKIYIDNQLQEFNKLKQELGTYTNFYFYIESDSGTKIFANTSIEVIEGCTQKMSLQGDFLTNNMNLYSGYHNQLISNGNYKLYAAIDNEIKPFDDFYKEQERFKTAKKLIPYFVVSSAVSVVAITLLMLFTLITVGQTKKHGEVKFIWVDKIYNDIHFIMFFITSVFMMFSIIGILNDIFYYNEGVMIYIMYFILGIIIFLNTSLILSYVCSVARQVKARKFLSNTFILNIIKKIGELISGKTFRGWIILLMLAYGALNVILTFITTLFIISNDKFLTLFMLFCIILFNILCVAILIKSLDSLIRIMSSAKETSRGNFNYIIDMTKISPTFINFARDIVNIQSGLKYAVDEAVKGERMKAELITNVSHDLKTPLTSIITYVDLLKKGKPDKNTANQYLNILEEKSARLKQLIEDLIEASKASSGNLSVNEQKVNLRLLVMQATGEFEEKIQDANLDFKINSDEEVYICADGKHMWRIIENLVVNATKYSIPNSRVYVDILKNDTMGILVMKNVSMSPIEINPETLTERFVRGDESRTTEGSGLGLSIAKSLTILQDGDFNVSVDGDLFKATIKIPLWKNDEEDEE